MSICKKISSDIFIYIYMYPCLHIKLKYFYLLLDSHYPEISITQAQKAFTNIHPEPK